MVYEIAINGCKQFFQNWKTSLVMNASQCSGHLYCTKPWIHTFWAHCSGTQCWLSPSGYLSNHALCSTI